MLLDGQWKTSTKRLRLFWVFIILAIPLMVLIVAYALGYRFDAASKQILQTTALAIETIPKDAVVVLNGQQAVNPTPFITTLNPGSYTIELQKPRYRPWKKQLQFEKGKSLIFPNIILFLDSEPVRRSPLPTDPPAEYTTLVTANDEMKKLYNDNNWLNGDNMRFIEGPWDIVVDTSTRTSYFVAQSSTFLPDLSYPATIIDADWSRDDQAILASEYELLLFTPHDQRIEVIYRQSNRFLDVEWHPQGGYIFFSDETGLFVLELDSRDHRQLWNISSLPSPIQLQISEQGDQLSFISNRQWYDLQLYN